MSQPESSNGAGCSGCSLVILTFALFLAKVCGATDIAWVWVFCPLWIVPAFVMFILLLVGGVLGIAFLCIVIADRWA